MQRLTGIERYLRWVLVSNGLGDILVGLALILLPGRLARMLGFETTDVIAYLSGGWGVAALSFGALRLFAGMSAHRETRWFVAVFGAVEGAILTAFGLAIMVTTPLSFFQVSLSTLFALAFGLAYGAAFLWQGRLRASGPRM